MDTNGNLKRQIEALETEVKQKQARLAKLRAQDRQREQKAARTRDTRRKILAGSVVLKKAHTDPDFAAQLVSWLREGLIEERDKAMFPELTPPQQ